MTRTDTTAASSSRGPGPLGAPLPASQAEPALHIPPGLAVLTAPGLHGSGPDHWQTRWERRFPDWQRVEQRDWACPSLHTWAGKLGEAVARCRQHAPAGVLVVAHSFGCLALLRQAAEDASGIAGALLVAPADPDRFGVAPLLPACRLPFPTLLVASRNDPWMAQRRAFSWGTVWGSELHDAGYAGHINADSSLGDWPEGLALLAGLTQRVEGAGLAAAGGADGGPDAGVWTAGIEPRSGASYI
ncbi:alpha/beta hydrolase [Cupriavidus sp. AU9028]|uniref:RBBP9/YdeN family alpha/beta hydrolase n=1 Tax=Cupriavidus sp. AU9028 TaxID=2871157 RepID=UPI001C955413|nr:alpha/beta hydrolase [Cupriavidus sp. AU9028]MBY4898039.1 alpha/beta hydrolase [Cupriavidus sp. AU9028]